MTEIQREVLVRSGRKITRSDILGLAVQATSPTELNLLSAEDCWINCGRPFFNLYPSVTEALSKSSLNVKPESIPVSIVHKLGALCVKLPSRFASEIHVSHFFIRISDVTYGATCEEELGASVCVAFSDRDSIFNHVIPFRMSAMESERVEEPETDFESDRRRKITRIAIGVMLLASDPEFIEPVLLKRDNGKEPTDSLIIRAKKRGVFGFDIGKRLESSPHFRRPHLGIRWTGKGRSTPRLTVVKGAWVNRSAITEIPTGFESNGRDTTGT